MAKEIVHVRLSLFGSDESVEHLRDKATLEFKVQDVDDQELFKEKVVKLEVTSVTTVGDLWAQAVSLIKSTEGISLEEE